MHCLGHYIPPVVTTLPATGSVGQALVYKGEVYVWSVAKGSWEPELSLRFEALPADVTETVNVRKRLFTIPLDDFAIYSLQLNVVFIPLTTNSAVRFVIDPPAANVLITTKTIIQSSSAGTNNPGGTDADPINLDSTSSFSAGLVGKKLFMRSQIAILTAATPGDLLIDMQPLSNGAGVTISAESFFTMQRID
jgi:hypothetical protein